MTTPSDSPTPALVVGSGVTVLGVTRLLGRMGIPTTVVAPRADLVTFSRWYPRTSRHLSLSGGLATFLEEFAGERSVLIPCGDNVALQAARLPEHLNERFLTFQSSESTLQTLVDKGRFIDVLRKFDIPHPKTVLLSEAVDIESLPDTSIPNGFLKPRDSQAFMEDTGVKALRPKSPSQFRRAVHVGLQKGHQFMIQEYVPGPASNHYFIDGFAHAPGRIHRLLARQRLRMYPTDFGNSSYMRTVPLEDAAEAVTSIETLVRGLQMRGVFSAEFKRDERDGSFRILEVNSRPWWYVEFAAQAGLNVIEMLYQSARGRPLPEEKSDAYQVGRSLVYPYFDYSACRANGGGLIRRAAREWLPADQPVFSWSDPFPAIVAAGKLLPGMLKRRIFRSAGWKGIEDEWLGNGDAEVDSDGTNVRDE